MESLTRFENSVRSLWTTNTVSQIAASLKSSNRHVYQAAKKLGLKSHKELAEERPTPEEIEERAEAIRKGWTEQEAARRYSGGPVPYAIPSYTSCQVFPDFQGRLR